jgi:hypothetical protein
MRNIAFNLIKEKLTMATENSRPTFLAGISRTTLGAVALHHLPIGLNGG